MIMIIKVVMIIVIIEKTPPPPSLKLELFTCWDTINKNKYNKNFDMQGKFIKK